MSGEWMETTLAEVSMDVGYGYTESATFEKVGPHFLRITDIQNGTVDWKSVPYCPITASEHQKYRLHPGDIVVARTGNSTGENYLCRGDEDAVFASYLIRFRVNPHTADPTFVWYNMRTARWRDFINSSKTGSAQAGANAKVLGRFPFPLPPLPEQRRIAKILGDLDDKIELNRKMNDTLEQMARALFKSWFIDFDPVRAKMEGRQPEGMDAETAALFPSRLVESELGLIPEGWEVGRLDDVIHVSRESVNPAAFPDDQFDHYSLPAFDEGRTPKCETGRSIKSNKLVVPADSILISKLNPHIPRTWLPEVYAERRSVCSTEFIVAIAKDGFSREYVFSVFTSPDFMTTYESLVTGTTGSHQRIKTESVLAIANVTPPQRLVQEFSDRIKPAFQRLQSNINQSRTLASLRDTLLPKLMRGEGYEPKN